MNLKGYNKVGVWSEISTEIKQCHVEDGHSHITPRMIIDATGESGNYISTEIKQCHVEDGHSPST
jgi:hypothetical protein